MIIVAGLTLGATTTASAGRFDTPEATLKFYISTLREGDRAKVAPCFEPPAHGFYLPGPLLIEQYVVRKRIVYGRAEVEEWNSRGIIPPAVEGDIELQVEETIAGRKAMFYYNVRRFGHEWKIISHSGSGWPD